MKSLFDSLAGLDLNERAFRLIQLDDAELAKELARLLANHDEAGPDFLGGNPQPDIDQVTEPASPPYLFQFEHGDLLSDRFLILRALGRGGMGEVYEAEDRELEIRSAIKVMSAEWASHNDVARAFRSEIQIARLITHPNVCRIHDLTIHRADGGNVLLLSMELIEGETLAQRLRRVGRMSIAEAEPLLRQLLAGLQAAHKVGIMHRDLKPSNLMLRVGANGSVEELVILDFGLARTCRSDASGAPPTKIMGTPVYMAPEQVRGRCLPESDIYGVGLILFEMLTGERPFEGDPLTQVLRRLVEDPRSPRSLLPRIPSLWERIIKTCLARDPAARFSTSADVVAALDRGIFPGSRPHLRTLASRHRGWLAAASASILAIALSIFLAIRPSSTPPSPVALSPLSTRADVNLDSTISENGKWVAYVSDWETAGNLELFVQASGGDTVARKLTSDGFDKTSPSFSPDARTIVFNSDRNGAALYTVPREGGVPKLIYSGGRDGRFSPNGRQIAFSVGEDAEYFVDPPRLYLISSSGGSGQRIAKDFYAAHRPVWLPDGRHLLFRGLRERPPHPDVESEWFVLDLESGRAVATGARELLKQAGLRSFNQLGNFVGRTMLFSARGETSANIYRASFDPKTLRIHNPFQQLTNSTALLSSPVWSRDGRIVVSSTQGGMHLWSMHLQNGQTVAQRQLTNSIYLDSRPTVTMDGRTIAFTRSLGGPYQIWLRDLQTGAERALWTADEKNLAPTIRPDGAEVAFSSLEGKVSALKVVSTQDRSVTTLCRDCGYPSGWSPDSRALLLISEADSNIYTLDRLTRRIISLTQGPNRFGDPQYSPNGRWLAFREDLDGQHSRLMLASFRDSQLLNKTSWTKVTDGNSWAGKPQWSADGKTIYFVSDRDGFECLWYQQVGSDGNPQGMPVSVSHFHQRSFSLRETTHLNFNFDIKNSQMFLNIPDLHANIWTGMVGIL